MVETLYKTKTPQNSRLDGEFYELKLEETQQRGRIGYRVTESHGWWDEGRQQTEELGPTLSPDEGYPTFGEAEDRYNQQRLHRAKSGFKWSCSPNMYGGDPVYREIDTTTDLEKGRND